MSTDTVSLHRDGDIVELELELAAETHLITFSIDGEPVGGFSRR